MEREGERAPLGDGSRGNAAQPYSTRPAQLPEAELRADVRAHVRGLHVRDLGFGGGVTIPARLGVLACGGFGVGLLARCRYIFFRRDIFLPVEDMGNIFSFLPVEDTGSVCGQARSGAGPGGYAGHAPTHSPRERPRRARPRCCAPRYGIFNYPILHQGIH